MTAAPVPVLGFSAWSGAGKTTLIKRLLPLLAAQGLRVGVIKHTHHDFEIDHPGKDSYELRKAGAAQMLVGSARRWALIVENDGAPEPSLPDLMQRVAPDRLDLILAEGFKADRFPRIEVHRPSLGRPLLASCDAGIIAIAADAPLAQAPRVPLLDLNQPQAIARFVLAWFSATGGRVRPTIIRAEDDQ
ncbi:MAG: molybdopterin-guanine dinucleotide biosynthesis protein B [Gammaproteobacteria bacterium]